MNRSTILALVLLFADSPYAASERSENVKDAIDVIVLFCVVGGDKFEVSGDAKIEGGLALKKIGATGSAGINISKSEARGLVEGLRESMSKVSAEQASEARKCMQPYIDRVLDLLIGKPATTSRTDPPKPTEEYGSIFINWPPSPAPCYVNYQIEMAGQQIVPQGPYYRVPNIRLGQTLWTIRGTVRCADGSFCQSIDSMQSGPINLRRDGTYTFGWGIVPGSPIGSECMFSLSG